MGRLYIVPFVLLFFGMGMIISTWYSLKDSPQFKEEIIRSQDYPIAVALLLIIAVIIQLISAKKETKKRKENRSSGDIKPANDRVPKKVIYVMIALLIFVLGVANIGYFVSTFLFVAFLFVMLNHWNKWLFSVIISFFITACLYLLFDLIGVYFPNTMLF